MDSNKQVITVNLTCFSKGRFMGCGNVWGTVYLRHQYGKNGFCVRCGDYNPKKKMTAKVKAIKKALGASRVIKMKHSPSYPMGLVEEEE